LWSSLPALAIQQVAYVLGHQRADILTIVAWTTLLIGIELGATARTRLHRAVGRLADRAVLRPASVATELEGELARISSRWALRGAAGVSVLLLVTWPRATEFATSWDNWGFGPAAADQILVLAAGATAGGLLGRLVYLPAGLSVILAFIGVKLVLEALHDNDLPFLNGGCPLPVPEMGTWLSLVVVAGVLATTTVTSLLKVRRDAAAARGLG